MNPGDEKIRAAVAEQAAEWLVANDEATLDAGESAVLAAWLKTSPLHIEEFLGVAAVARDLKAAGTDPAYSLEAILARARRDDDTVVGRLPPSAIAPAQDQPPRRTLAAAASMAACAVAIVGLFFIKNEKFSGHTSALLVNELHFETRHGEQMTRRLPDNSILHLNTDTAVTFRYGETERLLTLTSGQANFEVAHGGSGHFRVLAGSADIVDVGTRFDVRLEQDSTVVTVVEGRVTVGPSAGQKELATNSSDDQSPRALLLNANQQVRVIQGEWPAIPVAVDAQNATSWLRHEIVFDHEPLERVAAEYNRYAPKPIEIVTPALRALEITGTFGTDDPDSLIAFLRSLKGVRVNVTATQIRLSEE